MTAVYRINMRWDKKKTVMVNWSFRWLADVLSIDCGRRLMTTHACVVWGHSTVDIDSHKLKSWKVVHLRVITCSHWWTTFQLLSLWLSNVDGTVTSNDTCVVISRPSRLGSSRFHNSPEPIRDHMLSRSSVELWNVHYSRYTDTTVWFFGTGTIVTDVACVFQSVD